MDNPSGRNPWNGRNRSKDVYTNNAYILAGKILEDWTGESYQELVQKYVFNELDTQLKVKRRRLLLECINNIKRIA